MSVADRARSARRSTAIEGREKVTGEARYAYEYARRRASPTPRSCSRRSRRAHRARSTPTPALAAARRARGALARERAAPRRGRRASSRVLQSPRVSPTAARSSPPSSPRRLEAARQAARARAGRVRRAGSTTSSCAATTRGLYRPDEGQPGLPDRHRARATSTRRSRGADVSVDETYATPRRAQQPDGAARDDRRLGRRRRLTLYDSNQGASPVARTRREGVRARRRSRCA